MLIDNSPAMLAYSTKWILMGVKSEVADATSIPAPDGSVDILISSLGDPYNTATFWLEVARVLRTGGTALFTTPSPEWANSFRLENEIDSAEFVRRDGAVLMLPSFVPSEAAQLQMFSHAGLTLRESRSLTAGDMDTQPAPKLLSVGSEAPLLRGFTLVREH
jgi:SAM-dependent methyltransferase